MRICFIASEYATPTSPAGGLGNYVARTVQGLSQHGHEVHVLYPALKDNIEQYQNITTHAIKIVYSPNMFWDKLDRLAPKPLYHSYQLIKQSWMLHRYFARLHREKHFDLIQTANVQAVGLFFGQRKDPPHICRLSNYPPLWDNLAGTPESFDRRFRWALEKRSTCKAKAIYAPSDFVAKLTEKKYNLTHVDVIEPSFFIESKAGELPSNTPDSYLLFFGQMTQMKGVHIIAHALPNTFKAHPDLAMFFIGNPQAGAPSGGSMKKYILQYNHTYQNRIHFLPPMPHDRLYAYIQHAETILLPSLADNIPNTCLEAMGLGQIVIAAKGSCFEQLIENGKTGFLVKKNNAPALGETIFRVLQLSPNEKRLIKDAAKARIAHLRPKHTIPHLIEYYRKIIDSK